jgi:hypothetical protein
VLLSFGDDHVDAHPAWRLPAVDAGIDLAECHFRRHAAVAFLTIAFLLGFFVWRRRRDLMLMFRIVFLILTLFVAVCGVTSLESILTLWVPAYGIEGVTKGFLALISIVMTAAMVLLLPRLLVMSTRVQLQQAYA